MSWTQYNSSNGKVNPKKQQLAKITKKYLKFTNPKSHSKFKIWDCNTSEANKKKNNLTSISEPSYSALQIETLDSVPNS